MLIDRHTAKEKGELKYFTGKPCLRGHISHRWVNSGKCCECALDVTREWRKNGNKVNPDTKVKTLPSADYLNECFEYVDGLLYWKQRPLNHFKSERGWKIYTKLHAGKVAGYKHKVNNYYEVRLGGKLHKVHRVVYKMHYDFDESLQIDHINRDPSDNRLDNLRVVTNQENSMNRHNNKMGIV